MLHTSRIELSRSALKRNIRFLRKRIGRGTTFTSVVKANAYGHGLDVFVRLAEECGVRSFAVFSADEALDVVEARTRKSEVIIMGHVDDAQLEWAIVNGIAFYVFDLDRLVKAREAAKRARKPARVHLELETGLHRLGFEQDELARVAEIVREAPAQLRVEGCCTHYAGAESVSNYLRIKRQIETFDELCQTLAAEGIEAPRHTACSAAVLTYPETIMERVRVGIAQYGYWPSHETQVQVALERERAGRSLRRDPLSRVITWKSCVMSLKTVAPGEFVGYGTSYLANERMKIAVVPVGYGGGFTRGLSNRGRVLIRGRRLAVIGMVNMNMMLVDVTRVPGVSPGDEVVLIGKQKKREISVASFSEMSQFLNYEMLVRLPNEIPRHVVD